MVDPVQPESGAEATLGNFERRAELVVAPGVRLCEGIWKNGNQETPVLLQLASLLAAESAADEAGRRDYIDKISSATENLARDPDVQLLSHGAFDEPGGGVTLLWALPWSPETVQLGEGAAKVSSSTELLTLGITLAQRLARRHERGRFDPLLSAELIVLSRGMPKIQGFPIHLPAGWVRDDTPEAPWAPEERNLQAPHAAGDQWRLGQALLTMAREIQLEPNVEALLSRMVDPYPSERYTDASEVAEMMIRLLRESDVESPNATQAENAGPAAATAALRNARQQARDRRDLSAQPTLVDMPQTKREDLDGGAQGSLGRGPAQKDPTLRNSVWDKSRPSDSASRRPDPAQGTKVGVRIIDDPTGLRPAIEPDSLNQPSMPSVGDPNVTQNPGMPDPAMYGGYPPPYNPYGMVPPGYPSMPPMQAYGPYGPQGYMPPMPQGMPMGPSQSMPGQSMPNPAAQGQPPMPSMSGQPQPSLLMPTGEIEPTPSRGVGIFIMILGLIVALVAGLILSPMIMPILTNSRPVIEDLPSDTQFISDANTMTLSATPSDAIVVAEINGQVLGSVPLQFQLPEDGDIAVLVTAPKHQPMRVRLTPGGHIEAKLKPTPERAACLININPKPESPLKGVGVSIGTDEPETYRIPVSAVVHNPAGAWILRCPAGDSGAVQEISLKSQPRLPEEAKLTVVSPVGAQIKVDDKDLGKAPQSVSVVPGFRLVRVETLRAGVSERFVPVFTPVSLQMPQNAAGSSL